MSFNPLSGVVPIIARSAAAQISDQIVSEIQQGRLRKGDRIPPERDLAQRFGVSRPTIREALAALELAGVVESRKGSGTVVICTPAHVATWGVEVFLPHVFEARLTIEPELAALAAHKHYPEDVTELHRVLDDLEREYAKTGSYASDLPLHRAIARAARNPLLERALEEALAHTESARFTELAERALVASEVREGHVGEWRQVVAHIESGDATGAGTVWRQHLEYFRDEMLGRVPDRVTHSSTS